MCFTIIKSIMKKVIIYILLVFLLTPSLSNAQRWKRYKYEMVFGLGTINLFGDMGGGSGVARHNSLDFDIEGTRPGLYVGGRYKFQELLAMKINMMLGMANASDDYTDNNDRSRRGASSNVFMFEPSVQIEYSLVKERYSRRYTFANISRFNMSHVNTYLFIGAGALFYSPTVTRAVNTDVGEAHSIVAMAFPMGIGFKYAINRLYTCGLEIGNRYTTTDYLDGHSDKFSQANDSYLFLLFSVSKRLRSTRKGLPRF